jgi:ATP-dependent exoDNAse (exonuclease V) beta subunit
VQSSSWPATKAFFRSTRRVADAADEAELDDIYETERRLLYVACTRAREHLLLTGVMPTSEYLRDFALPAD